MERFLSWTLGCIICLLLLIATERRAFAYVDPGSGLLAIQTLASVLVGAVYMMRRRLRALWNRQRPKDKGLEAEKPGASEAA